MRSMVEGALQSVRCHAEDRVGRLIDIAAAYQLACGDVHNSHIL